jgi:hypothetical protein
VQLHIVHDGDEPETIITIPLSTAEECLAMAREASDEDQLMQSVQMALYWFDQAKPRHVFTTTPRRVLAGHKKAALQR